MHKKRKVLYLLLSSLIVATLGHIFFLAEWLQDRYMVGPNDGLQQMLPFKKLLYEQYTSGNFFYSSQFGLGGGTYSQLAFYYTTSFIFILTVLIVYLLQTFHLIGPADILFWANVALVVSIARLALIIAITTTVFKYMKSDWLPAFIGASFYGLSAIYFRHVTYWEFFADAMLWLPILVFGAEKIIKEKRPGWFIVSMAITLINNFYFAYINIIFIFVYIVFRWFIILGDNETSKRQQLKLYFYSSFLGFGISAIAFIPAVYGYLHNYRPRYDNSVHLFSWDNILFDSRFIVIPTIFLIFTFSFCLYKNRIFLLFTAMSILFILCHFSPIVASAFNGFSAPQYRWEYILSFTIAGSIVFGLQQKTRLNKRGFILSSLMVSICYVSLALLDESVQLFSALSLAIFGNVLITILLLLMHIWRKDKLQHYILYIGLLILVLAFANIFQYGLSLAGGVNKVSKSYLLTENYNGKDQRAVIQQIKQRDAGFYRIDWKVSSLNNTPIVQDYNGISVYGSILNEHLLYFYLNHMNIDTGRESVSRYATFGNRANLYSLLQGKYMIREKDKLENVPHGFKEIVRSKGYIVFENTNVLPFVRTAKVLFSEKNMEQASDLAKEHAMLEGVIVPNTNGKRTTSVKPLPQNIINHTQLETVNASYNDNKLTVTEEMGGIDILTNGLSSDTKDLYFQFYLKNFAVDQGFTMKVNDYKTTRKSNQSIYKTEDDLMTIRLPRADKIKIRLPKGNYILKGMELYKENYKLLESAKREEIDKAILSWEDNKISIRYDNQNSSQFIILPIPFEKGWKLHVNNKKEVIEKVNYAFIGFKIREGVNRIKLVYYPPYYLSSLLITIISLFLSILFYRREH